MASSLEASEILDELVGNVRRYNDLTRRLADCLKDAETLHHEAVHLRLDIEGMVGVLKNLATNVADEATRKLFLVLADCFGAAEK
jgi:hypothetical protein